MAVCRSFLLLPILTEAQSVRPFELFIGLRYTRAKRRNHFISFISLISMLGVMLGVMALIVVLSVMNGFQDELRNRILAVASHATISGPDNLLYDWESLDRKVLRHPDVTGAAPYVMQQGMLSYGQTVQGALIRGVDPRLENQVADFAAKMKVGSFDSLQPGRFGIVLGIELARNLGVGVGDKLVLIAPQGQVTVAGVVPRLKTFTVTGVFEAGMYEFDSGLALINLRDAQVLYRMGGAVSGLRLKVRDLFDAPRVVQQLAVGLPADMYFSDWTKEHANFFRAVQIEKRMMFIILLLIVAVASFNIVSTLVMAVTDKEADIAILRTLGAAPRSIMAIFMIQGAVIGVIGTLLGLISGVLIAVNIETIVPAIERLFHTQFLAKDVYYISELPSKLAWSDVGVIGSVSLLLSLLATLYPSWRASRTQPAEALRYE